jgi:TMEM175 potassium channel family protein
MPTAHDTGAQKTDDPSLSRVGTFSDGVFAIAITLLVLAIRIPHPTDADADQGLLTLLTREWRSYLAFVLSFMLVGINWANHRLMFATFVRADHTLVWLNLLYLMLGVAFMPVPTAVLGAWLGSPDNQVVAAVFYGAAGTMGALTFILLWWYGAYAAKLTSPELSPRQRRAHTIAWGPAPFVIATLTAVAFASPAIAVAGYVAVVLVYMLPVPRLVALEKQRRHARGRG